jgi:hypothetical protein
MSQRYSLRFESGERRGETVPVRGPTFTVGRKSGSDLQIAEASVSGRHAELVVDDEGVTLRDLGSTNGTRVAGERVLEVRLANGAAVTFGHVEMRFADAEAPSGLAREELAATRVSAERLARVRRGSRAGIVLFALGAAGAAGAYWYLNAGGAQRERAVRPVEAVSGNLLAAGYSFEGEDDRWSARDNVEAAFRRSAAARYSGERGISASLEPGETALHESPLVVLPPGKACAVRGVVRCTEGGVARLGLQLSASAEGGPAAFTLWSAAVEPGGAFESVAWNTSPPPGYDRARVVVLGRALGAEAARVDADDVSLVLAGASAPALALAEYRLWPVGAPAPAGALVLSRLGDPLLSGLHVQPEGAGLGRVETGLTFEVRERRMRIAPVGGGPHTLVFRIEAPAVEGGLASMGTAAPEGGGYAKHHDGFERDALSDLLLGSGVRLLRLHFDAPARVTADAYEGGFRVQAELSAGGLEVQTTFQEERVAALSLASEARAARRAGKLGDCLAKWDELLDRFPYEEAVVAEAEVARTELVQAGLAETRAVAQEIERARFFRLVDLFRLCRRQAEAVAVRYAGSEVEVGARALMAEVDTDLAGLEADLDRHEVARLSAILTVFEAQEWQGLASEVRSYLRDEYGEER